MKNFLSPEKIYSNVENGKLSKAIAAELLISLIEGSDNPTTRAESIKISEKLKIHDKKTFKILENSLLSDESPLVRKSAAKFIGQFFLKEGLNWRAALRYRSLINYLRVFFLCCLLSIIFYRIGL